MVRDGRRSLRCSGLSSLLPQNRPLQRLAYRPGEPGPAKSNKSPSIFGFSRARFARTICETLKRAVLREQRGQARASERTPLRPETIPSQNLRCDLEGMERILGGGCHAGHFSFNAETQRRRER